MHQHKPVGHVPLAASSVGREQAPCPAVPGRRRRCHSLCRRVHQGTTVVQLDHRALSGGTVADTVGRTGATVGSGRAAVADTVGSTGATVVTRAATLGAAVGSAVAVGGGMVGTMVVSVVQGSVASRSH